MASYVFRKYRQLKLNFKFEIHKVPSPPTSIFSQLTAKNFGGEFPMTHRMIFRREKILTNFRYNGVLLSLQKTKKNYFP